MKRQLTVFHCKNDVLDKRNGPLGAPSGAMPRAAKGEDFPVVLEGVFLLQIRVEGLGFELAGEPKEGFASKQRHLRPRHTSRLEQNDSAGSFMWWSPIKTRHESQMKLPRSPDAPIPGSWDLFGQSRAPKLLGQAAQLPVRGWC